MLLYIGAPAVNRDSGCGQGYTFIDEINPCNGDGTITEIKIYMELVGAGGNVTVGIFYGGGGEAGSDDFTCRSIVAITGLSIGLNTKTVSIAVETGDMIGVYLPVGDAIELGTSGGIRRWTSDTAGNKCVVDLTSSFSSLGSRILSLRGTGSTGVIYPPDTDPAQSERRVSGIRHIYRPGSYRMEVSLGGVSTVETFELYEPAKKPAPVLPATPTPRPSVYPMWPETEWGPGEAKKPGYEYSPLMVLPGLWIPGQTMAELSPELRREGLEPAGARRPTSVWDVLILGAKYGYEQALSPLKRLWRVITPWKEEIEEKPEAEEYEKYPFFWP